MKNKNAKTLKTYQSFARINFNSELINTEIKAASMKDARKWFSENVYESEKVYLKK